jgi:F-type H+-transporting ATPase subunit a
MEVHVEVAAETLFNIGPVPVTNSMLTMFIVMALILGFLTWIARNMKEVPGRAQSLVEVTIEFLLGLVESAANSRSAARRIFPLIGGLFIFIAIANYSGMLPGVGTIGYWEEHAAEEGATHEETTTDETTHDEESGSLVYEVASAGQVSAPAATRHAEESEKVLVPFFRAPNADINMTLAMALVSFVVVQIAGIRAHGVRGRIKHMATPAFIFPIEVVSELSRIISLSARLFGNVFAGEVLLGVMYAMANAIKIAVIPVALPVIFLFLELMFGTIQALVFALLTLIYIALATEGGHEEHAEGHAAEHGHAAAPAGAHGD